MSLQLNLVPDEAWRAYIADAIHIGQVWRLVRGHNVIRQCVMRDRGQD